MDGINLEYLTRYRDEVLQPTGFGRFTIRTYYWFSKGLTPLAGKSGVVRWWIRNLFYRPATSWAKKRVNRKKYREFRGNRRTKKAVRTALERMKAKENQQ